jgi:hypothetical protein
MRKDGDVLHFEEQDLSALNALKEMAELKPKIKQMLDEAKRLKDYGFAYINMQIPKEEDWTRLEFDNSTNTVTIHRDRDNDLMIKEIFL